MAARIGWDRIEMSPRLRQKHRFIYFKIQHSESHERRTEPAGTQAEEIQQSASSKQLTVKPVSR